MGVPDKDVPINQDDIKISGLTNPTYLVIVGFATRRVYDQALRTVDPVTGKPKQIAYTLIIEPDLATFNNTLKTENVRDLIEAKNVDMIIGIPPDRLFPEIYKVFIKEDKAVGSRCLRSMQPEIISDPFAYPFNDGKPAPVVQEIADLVQETAKQVFMSMGCASDSHFRWEQLYRNKENLKSAYKIEPLFGKFGTVPAIVVGAGPSMEDFITAYHRYKLREKSVIIACDASLKRLLKHDIKPHIVTRCERKLTKIFSGIEKKDTQDIYYAAYPWTDKEFFDLFDDKFMLFRDNGVCHWTGYKPGAVNGGVSSANAALELAFLMGCQNIVLTGIDLCFQDGKSHVDGTEVEFDIENSRPKWTEITGNDGLVTTIPVWKRCLNEYTKDISRHPGHDLFNTSLKGAKILGTQVKPWAEISHLFESDAHAGRRISKNLVKPTEEANKKFEANCEELKENLKILISDIEKVLLTVRDQILTCSREEEKLVMQLANFTFKDYFDQVFHLQKQLTNVFQAPAKTVDGFKAKYYTKSWFNHAILDTCQLDLMTTENKCAGLVNTIPIDHNRLKIYCQIQTSLFTLFMYYAKKMLTMFETGKTDYDVDCGTLPESPREDGITEGNGETGGGERGEFLQNPDFLC